MARTGHGISAGEKHKLCQRYLLEHPEAVLEALFNGHHGDYSAVLMKEYPTEVFHHAAQSPKLDIVAEITGRDYREIVVVEIKGNTDDRRLEEAIDKLRKYRRQIGGENGNPFLKSAGIRRGMVFQGYETNGEEEPKFRVTPVSFNSEGTIE